jgi:hypothetical protein
MAAEKQAKAKSDGSGWRPGDLGALAVCRFQTGGDLPAAILLYHLKWRLRGTNGDLGKIIGFKEGKDPNSGKAITIPITERTGPLHKVLTRKGYQWIAASRLIWAKEAGLTLREYDRAIHVLRRFDLITAKNWKLGPKVSVWIRVNWNELPKMAPSDVELYEGNRGAGFRIFGGKKQPLFGKRHRMNRKEMKADADAFMAKIATIAAEDPEAISPDEIIELSPTENSEDFAMA